VVVNCQLMQESMLLWGVEHWRAVVKRAAAVAWCSLLGCGSNCCAVFAATMQVIAFGEGHNSWVMRVQFDPYNCGESTTSAGPPGVLTHAWSSASLCAWIPAVVSGCARTYICVHMCTARVGHCEIM
jgi:hypothetical protein